MAFSDLTSNQMVTFTDAQSGGFALKAGQAHVTSNQCMTKSEVLTKYNLDATVMNSYTNNQLVPKSTWVSAVVYYSYGVNSRGYLDGNGWFITTEDAGCTSNNIISTFYSNSATLGIGTILYRDTNLTTLCFPTGNTHKLYAYTGGFLFNIGSGSAVTSITNCTPAPTYTQVFNKFYDPCGSQVNNLYEDALGKYYLLVSGNYGLYSGYLYTYFGPVVGDGTHTWSESYYLNGEFVNGSTVNSICAPS